MNVSRLALLVCASVGFCYSTLSHCPAARSAGKQAESPGQHAVKLAELNETIKRQPRDANAYLTRAVLHAGAEEENEAIADYNKAAELDPSSRLIFYSRADFYMSTEDYIRARDDYAKSASLAKTNTDKAAGYLQAGRSECKAKHYASALAYLDKAFPLSNPTQKNRVNLNRALTHLGLKQYEAAVTDINAMEPYVEAWEDAAATRAAAYMGLGKYDKAVPDWTNAIKTAVTRPSSLTGVVFQTNTASYFKQRAVCFEKMGKNDLARADRRKADVAQEDSLMFAPFR